MVSNYSAVDRFDSLESVLVGFEGRTSCFVFFIPDTSESLDFFVTLLRNDFFVHIFRSMTFYESHELHYYSDLEYEHYEMTMIVQMSLVFLH